MKVECSYDKMVKLEDIIPHPDNTNDHPQEQIEILAKIMNRKVRKPITVSLKSGFITSGHARLEAAKLNGWDEYPVDYQNYDTDAEEFEDLTADNKLASYAEFNTSKFNEVFVKYGPELSFEMAGMPDFKVDPSEVYGEDLGKQAEEFIDEHGVPLKKEKLWMYVEFEERADYDNIRNRLGQGAGRVISLQKLMELVENGK